MKEVETIKQEKPYVDWTSNGAAGETHIRSCERISAEKHTTHPRDKKRADSILFGRIEETGERLRKGNFRREKFPLRRLSHTVYAKAYGYFRNPSTIVLDENLPLYGKTFKQPSLATTATYYCAAHEVVQAITPMIVTCDILGTYSRSRLLC